VPHHPQRRRLCDNLVDAHLYAAFEIPGVFRVAVYVTEGTLPTDAELGEKLRGVTWRRLNEQYRRYEEVLRHIYAERGIERERAEAYIDAVLRRLAAMRLRLKKPTG